MCAGLLLNQDPAFPLPHLAVVMVVVIGPSAISEVGLILTLEPVSGIGPIILAVAVHPSRNEITNIVGFIRKLNRTFAFDFVNVVSQFNFSFVDNSDSEFNFYS